MINTQTNGGITPAALEISTELQLNLLETLGSHRLPVDLEEEDMKDRLLCFKDVKSMKFDIGIPVNRGDPGGETMYDDNVAKSTTAGPSAHIMNPKHHKTHHPLESLKMHGTDGSISKNGGALGLLKVSGFRADNGKSSIRTVSAASGQTTDHWLSDEENSDKLRMRKGKFVSALCQ